MTRRMLLVLGFFLALNLALVTAIAADGGKAKNVIYQGEARPQNGNGSSQFTIDTSPIIFYLGTVNNKYHVLLIRVKNDTNAPVKLSKDEDTIELRFPGAQPVKGILNLPATDRGSWDGLETEIRTAVAYPETVPAHEEEGIYVYVRVGDVKGPRKKHEMPGSIQYNIKSLPQPVELRQRGVSKA